MCESVDPARYRPNATPTGMSVSNPVSGVLFRPLEDATFALGVAVFGVGVGVLVGFGVLVARGVAVGRVVEAGLGEALHPQVALAGH